MDENSQVDDHLVGGTLRLKVLEHDSGAEKGDCLVNNIDFVISLRGRASRIASEGKNWEATRSLTFNLAEVGVVSDERCFLKGQSFYGFKISYHFY